MKAYGVFSDAPEVVGAWVAGSKVEAWGWAMYMVSIHLVRHHAVEGWPDLGALVNAEDNGSELRCTLCGESIRVQYVGEVQRLHGWRVFERSGFSDSQLGVYDEFSDAVIGAVDRMLDHVADVHGSNHRVRMSDHLVCHECGFTVWVEPA